MRASEEHAQAFVGKGLLRRRLLLGGLSCQGERHRKTFPDGLPSHRIDQPPASGGQEPRLRPLRDAVARPTLEGTGERVGERVLGSVDIVRPPRHEREQPAVRIPRRLLGNAVCDRPVQFWETV